MLIKFSRSSGGTPLYSCEDCIFTEVSAELPKILAFRGRTYQSIVLQGWDYDGVIGAILHLEPRAARELLAPNFKEKEKLEEGD
jgi:hypothetical protein